MKWQIAAVGKPSLRYARDGIAEYRKRLQRYANLSIELVQKDRGKEKNGQQLLQMTEGTFRIALDERGTSWTTGDFVKRVEGWQMDGVKRVSILIGGAEGHGDEIRETADCVISLSGFTMQHELALLVLMEQIYRVHTVMKGEPYHR